jgi:hypothetical protein
MKIYKIATVDVKDTKNTIAKAAILYNGNIYTGWRHASIGLDMLANGFCKRPYPGGPAQGFVTDSGIFVSREEAMKIAKASGQISQDHNKNELFSEDLWDINGKPIVKLEQTRDSYHSLDMHDGVGEDDGY